MRPKLLNANGDYISYISYSTAIKWKYVKLVRFDNLVASNTPKLADNMSAVVISSVLMATLSMATTRGAGTATSTAGSAVKSGLSKILRR